MSGELLRSVEAAIAIRPPGIDADFVRVNLKLSKLTVLVGPNASGKTTVLQTIGYLLSSLLEPVGSSLGIALTRTLRPTGDIPYLIGGTLTLDGVKVRNLILTPQLQLLKTITPDMLPYNVLLDTLNFDKAVKRKLMLEIEDDAWRYGRSIVSVEEKIQQSERRLVKIAGEKSTIIMYGRREEFYMLLREFVRNVLGENIQIAASSPYRGVKPLEEGLERESYELLRYLLGAKKENIRLSYIVTNGTDRISKTIIVGIARATTIVFKSKRDEIGVPKETSSVMVFHPGFIFSKGIFEGLYSYYARKGLQKEKEALELLRKYIPWVEGYELYGHSLSLKASDGRRISVYSLSDGYRVAVFMSLLYALSRGSVVFLIDTPEAFVHPDGLPIIADFITRLVENGNQVVVATQSIEFLRKLLLSAREYDVISNTLVEKVDLSRDGMIRPTGVWSGKVSLDSIDKLGLDLRR